MTNVIDIGIKYIKVEIKMNIIEYIFEKLTIIEILFLGIIFEGIILVLLVKGLYKIARMTGLMSEQKFQDKKALQQEKIGFQKAKPYLYLIVACAVPVSVGFKLGWHSNPELAIWHQGQLQLNSSKNGARQASVEATITQLSTSFIKDKNIRDLCVGVQYQAQSFLSCFSQAKGAQQLPTNGDSVFEIGSITKTFTNAAMIKILAKHNIAISSAIGDYLPDSIRTRNPKLAKVTWAQLSTHTSGLSSFPFDWNLVSARSFFEIFTLGNSAKYLSESYVSDYLEQVLIEDPLDNSEQKKAQYSNMGVGLIGLLLSQIEEKSYSQLIEDTVLKPLQMSQSIAGAPKAGSKAVDGYGQFRRMGSLLITAKAAPTLFSDAMAGAGAINSTLEDMMKYLNNSMAQYATPVFQNALYTSSLSAKTTVNLGWIVTPLNEPSQHQLIMHNGGTGGFRSFMGFEQTNQVGIVILSNGTRMVDPLAEEILQLFVKPKETQAELATI
jgi:CubicO group peptidase (beta-lactamase class C family)